jgi:nucleoside-diphosphate-sugar epimerase
VRVAITGGAGFIGSHLVDACLARDWEVIVIDNLSTGRKENLTGHEGNARLHVLPLDIVHDNFDLSGVDVIFHQAALPSVPRSIADPMTTHLNNTHGTLRVLEHARRHGVRRFVYASSSSVYGDALGDKRREVIVGAPLSPYAASKQCVESYALAYGKSYGMDTVGLRYFNVYGPRQDPDGSYSAVIPRWIKRMLSGEPYVIYGDGTTTRDFTYVSNVVTANLLAATTKHVNLVYNVAMGKGTTLLQLSDLLEEQLTPSERKRTSCQQEAFRGGDIRLSVADVTRARKWLGLKAGVGLREGLRETVRWYRKTGLA